MPTSVFALGGSPAQTAAIRPNSPSEASVGGSSGAMAHLRTPRITGARVLHGLDLYGSVSEQGRLSRNPWEDLMVEAYILVQTEVGKAADVASLIRKISGVAQAEDVTGPYDVIVRAQADDVDELGRLVTAHIQAVPGITRTLTCPVVHI